MLRSGGFPAVVGFLVLSFLAGCKNDEITSYHERAGTPIAGAATSSSADNGLVEPPSALQREVSWKTPIGWVQQKPSAMRAASFAVSGKDGLAADVSVVVLFGVAGTDLANVNRWRGQLGLPEIREDALPKVMDIVSSSGREMHLVDFSSQAGIAGKRRQRILAAIHRRGESTWFFKMTGDDDFVESQRSAFLRFLENVRFRDAS